MLIQHIFVTKIATPLPPPPQVGTSSVVYPAAGYAPMLAARGVPVAEFNLEDTPVTGQLKLVHLDLFLTATGGGYCHRLHVYRELVCTVK